jgi:hypothetical protein
MKTIAKIALFVALATVARADNIGQSYIGLCSEKWPCNLSIAQYRSLDVIRAGWLEDTTFNQNRCACSNLLLQTAKPKIVRIHIANGTCFPERGRRCQAGEVFAGESIKSAETKLIKRDPVLLNRLRVAAAKTAARIAKGRNISELYISPVMESSFNAAARLVTLDVIRPYFPTAKFVDNPVTGTCLGGYVCEKHGEKPGLSAPCISDLDGADFGKVDLIAYAQRTDQCSLSLVWGLKYNLIDHHNPNFVEPRKRAEAPSQAYFTAATVTMLNGGKLPPAGEVDARDQKQCRRSQAFGDGPGGRLWKQSDTHPGVVAIFPKGARIYSRLNAWKGGKVVANFKYTYLLNGDRRPVYRTTKPAKDFRPNTVLNGDGDCYVVQYPNIRQE